jgi:hypothetical protein
MREFNSKKLTISHCVRLSFKFKLCLMNAFEFKNRGILALGKGSFLKHSLSYGEKKTCRTRSIIRIFKPKGIRQTQPNLIAAGQFHYK